MPADRLHDVSGLTAAQLERARRDLQISLALPSPGSPPLALTWAQGTGGIISSLAGLTTWDRALYSGQLLPPRQQHQLESLVSEATGQPIARTTLADPAGYGLGVNQVFSAQTGAFWEYEGETYGNRVVHYYFPRSGMIIALAVNSATELDNDALGVLAGSVYQTLQNAGA